MATDVQRSDAAPTGSAEPARVTRRYTSLDSCRGLLLLVNVAAISLIAPRPWHFSHAEWFGVPFLDTIFPTFVTLSGCGLAFAYRRSVRWRRTARRCLVLLGCGLAYNAIIEGSLDLETWRVTGVLQLYAILVLVVAILHRLTQRPGAWIAITAVVAAAHGTFLWLWQATCPGATLTPECNPSQAIDPAVFGAAHIYAGGVMGHDPEGLVTVMGALVTTCVGVTAGLIMLASRGTRLGPLRLAGWASAVLIVGAVATVFLPAMKRLWTTPFALLVGGGAILVLAIAMLLLDLPAGHRVEAVRGRISGPLVAMGRNSLLIYFGSHLVLHVLFSRGGEESWAETFAQSIAVFGYPRAMFIIAMVALWAIIAAVLHRRRIYLRA